MLSILTHAGRYLDTLGHWSTYRGIASMEEIPNRVAQVTYTFTGLAGLLEGRPRLTGLLGIIIAVHALEQMTGGLATAAMGLAAGGKPLARYRGLLIRRSPLVRLTPLLNHLPGLKVGEATGYYFTESGRTWHCEAVTLELAGTTRTLTRLGSLSLPHREYLFDRPVTVRGFREAGEGERTVSIQAVVDLVKDDKEPAAIPGFIGSINELESLVTPLRGAKQFLFMANWLLIDPAERDEGSDLVDYDSLAKGKPPGGWGGSSASQMPLPPAGDGPRGNWPSTSRTSGQSIAPALKSVPIRTVDPTSKPVPIRPVPSSGQIPMNFVRPTPAVNSRQPPPPPLFPDSASPPDDDGSSMA